MAWYDFLKAPSAPLAAAKNAQVGGTNNASGQVVTGGNLSRDALNTGYDTGLSYLNSGANAADDALKKGLNLGTGYLTSALQPWGAVNTAAQAGMDLYGKLVGLNGSDMNAALESVPGYTFTRDQALDAGQRLANASGMWRSGNDIIDQQDRAANVAKQNWASYVNAVAPYLNLAVSGANGATGVYNNLANLASGTYNNIANNANQFGTNASNLATGKGTALANNYTNQYDTIADLNLAKAQAIANYWGGVNNQNVGAINSGVGLAEALISGGAKVAGAYAPTPKPVA